MSESRELPHRNTGDSSAPVRAFDDHGEPIQHPLCRIDGPVSPVVVCARHGSFSQIVSCPGCYKELREERNELLAALKSARQIIRENWRDEALADGYWPTLKPKIDDLDAAIAKAEAR